MGCRPARIWIVRYRRAVRTNFLMDQPVRASIFATCSPVPCSVADVGHPTRVYDGPIIDAHTHPMLDGQDRMVAEAHPPDAYRAGVALT